MSAAEKREVPAKERPILFSGPMVRAILAGQKTQTRRLVTARGWDPNTYRDVRVQDCGGKVGLQAFFKKPGADDWHGVSCPYGQVGDRLWVRERFYCDHAWAGEKDTPAEWLKMTYYGADYMTLSDWANAEEWAERTPPWTPSIHMPRWASRILLEVTSVRVERLQDISEGDAWAEGATTPCRCCVRDGGRIVNCTECPGGGCCPCCLDTRAEGGIVEFRDLWDSINGKRAPWASNPWVWVVGFKVLEGCNG